MAKASITIGPVTVSNTVSATIANDFAAYAVATYKAADGTDQTTSAALKDMARATWRGMAENLRRWKDDQKRAALTPEPETPYTEDP